MMKAEVEPDRTWPHKPEEFPLQQLRQDKAAADILLNTISDTEDSYLLAVGGGLNGTMAVHQPLNGSAADFRATSISPGMMTLAVVLGMLAITTILGNLLVCVTVLSFRRLQNATNYFILSLAFSDFLLGCLVLPFSNLYTVLDSWPLGVTFCNIYVSTDVMLCTVSILNLFAISLDRYYAVTSPFRYQTVMTNKTVALILGVIWMFSFAISFVPIHLGWNYQNGTVQNTDTVNRCDLQGNAIYVLFVAVGTYFAPLIIMCTVYLKVFAIARKQVKRIQEMGKYGTKLGNANSEDQSVSDTKATITLASVVLAFAICWVPYFTLFTARPFVSGGFPKDLDLFALWLGYVNSMLNPFLYAFHNTEFRTAFTHILCKRLVRAFRKSRPAADFV